MKIGTISFEPIAGLCFGFEFMGEGWKDFCIHLGPLRIIKLTIDE
jgi:hypothetical protein